MLERQTRQQSATSAESTHARRALSFVQFAVGLPFGVLAPRLADIKATLGVGNGAYGTAIAIGGLGIVLGTWLGGQLTHRFGSRRLLAVTASINV